ncbi:MAG: hypothetical protein U0359_13715 [Byssovorax sp.]
MRMFFAASIGGWMFLAAQSAQAQFPPAPAPSQVPGPSTAAPPPMLPPPAMSPGYPPPLAPELPPQPGPLYPASPAPPVPSPPPAAPPSWSDTPVNLSHRAGFGFGLWAAPVIVAGSSTGLRAGPGAPGALGGLGALGTGYGGLLSLRYWVSDRLLLSPALVMGISHSTNKEQSDYLGNNHLNEGSFTEGTFAPSLSLGFAAYRGKTNRFLLFGGIQFAYSVYEDTVQKKTVTDEFYYQYEPVTNVSVGLPIGLGFEQFFTPRLSICLSASSPIFSYVSSKTGSTPDSSRIGADFASTLLGGTVFFYTD